MAKEAKTQAKVVEKKEEKVEAIAPTNTKKVNWTVTLIMSILFGSLGVDRFIMGQVLLGILKLITFGGCGIWWIIDVILIASKHKFEGIEWVQ